MKIYTTAAIFAAVSVCAIAPVQASPAEEYIALMDQTIQGLNDMADVMESIINEETADEAAPKLKELRENLRPIVGDLQEVVNDELAEETLQEIMSAYEKSLQRYEATQIRIFQALKRLKEENYYDSEDLEAVFTPKSE